MKYPTLQRFDELLPHLVLPLHGREKIADWEALVEKQRLKDARR